MKILNYIIILNLIFIPSLAWADVVIENNSYSSVNNSIDIKTNTGGIITGTSDKASLENGTSKVDISIETTINGEEIVSERIIEEGESVNIEVKNEVKENSDGEISSVFEKKINDEKVEVKTNTISVDTVKTITESPSNEVDEIETEVSAKESASAIDDAENDNSIGICGVEEACEEAVSAEKTVEPKFNILIMINDFFTGLISKLFKLLTR